MSDGNRFMLLDVQVSKRCAQLNPSAQPTGWPWLVFATSDSFLSSLTVLIHAGIPPECIQNRTHARDVNKNRAIFGGGGGWPTMDMSMG